MGDPLGSPRVASLPFFSFKIRFNFIGSIDESFCFFSWRKRERGQGAGARLLFVTGGAGERGIIEFGVLGMTDAIIPALTHRIPSELRSEACLGESSTRMGDHLGSPRVASLFFS